MVVAFGASGCTELRQMSVVSHRILPQALGEVSGIIVSTTCQVIS